MWIDRSAGRSGIGQRRLADRKAFHFSLEGTCYSRVIVLLTALANDPGSHAALVLNDGGLQGIDEFAFERFSEVQEKGFVDEIALGSVGREETPTSDRQVLLLHADGRGETAEQETARLEDAPCTVQHGFEVQVGGGKVKYGVEQNDVGEGVGERHGLDVLGAEVGGGKKRRKRGCEVSHFGDGFGIRIDAEDLIAFAEEIDEIATISAAGVEDAHSRTDVAAEKLVEEVDVDEAEVFMKSKHRTE